MKNWRKSALLVLAMSTMIGRGTAADHLGGRSFDRPISQATARTIVRNLYLGVLGRRPDPQGEANWVRTLYYGGYQALVQDLAIGFGQSTELGNRVRMLSPRNIVTTMYRQLLCREPDPQGLRNWMDLVIDIRDGYATGDQLVHGFVASQEFANFYGL